MNNIQNILQGKRLEGASTITQQVAKNFLLTSEVSLRRKIKEAILAFRIEKAYSKKRILGQFRNITPISLSIGPFSDEISKTNDIFSLIGINKSLSSSQRIFSVFVGVVDIEDWEWLDRLSLRGF